MYSSVKVSHTSNMVKRSLACSVEIDVHSVASPGVCLPKRDAVYLVIQLFGQVCRTKAARPIFPIRYNEKCRFKKVFSSSCELSQVAELLEGMIITIKLMQVVSSFGLLEDAGDVMLAYHQSNASCFLYPSSTLCPNTKCRRLLLHRTICFPGENPVLEFASTAIIHEATIPSRRQWKCGVTSRPPVDVFRPSSRSPTEPGFVRYSKPISSYRMARECKDCGCIELNDDDECLSDNMERKVTTRSRKATKTKRMKSQATLLRPCSSLFIHDNCTSKRRSPSQRYRRHARASSSEPHQATCSCDSEEDEAFVKRHRRKNTKKHERSPRSTEARSQLECYESRTGFLRRLLEQLESRRPASDGRPPFVVRKVESKEFRRTPGLSDFGEETMEQRRLREMIEARESPRDTETMKPQSRVISQFDVARERMQRKSPPSSDGLYWGSLSTDCPICQAYLKYLGKPYLGHLHDDEQCGIPPQSRKKNSRRVEFEDFRCPDDWRSHLGRAAPTSRSTPPRDMGTPERACPCEASHHACVESCKNDDLDLQFSRHRRSPKKTSRKSFDRQNRTTCNEAYATPDTTDLIVDSSPFNTSLYKIPDCSTTVRNCYASEPPWNTDRYPESRRKSAQGSQPTPRCGTPPLFVNDIPVLRKSPARTSRRNTERLGCGSLDAENGFQPRQMDERDVLARSVMDSGCTFVTPSFVTENSTRESDDRFLETSNVSRRKGSSRSRCHEKSIRTATGYSTAEGYRGQSAAANDIYAAPEVYSQAPDIEYTVVRHSAVLASDDLATHGKDRFVSTSKSPRSQFVSSMEDCVDLYGVQNESTFTHVSPISQHVTPSSSSRRGRSRKSSHGQFVISPSEQVCPDQTSVWLDGSHISPISQHVTPSSSSRRSRSRKASNGQFVTSPSEQVSPYQAPVWLNGSHEISQIQPTCQPCVASSQLPFNRGGSYVSSEQSPTGQYVSSEIDTLAPKSFSALANGVEVVSPYDQLLSQSNFSRRHRSRRSSRRSRKSHRGNCTLDQVGQDNFPMARDVTYTPYEVSHPQGQYMTRSLDQEVPDNFSPTINGSHIPSQDLPTNHYVASSLNQVASDNFSPAVAVSHVPSHDLSAKHYVASSLTRVAQNNPSFTPNDSRRISSKDQNETSSLNHVGPDSFFIGDVSRDSSQMPPKQSGETTLVEPLAPTSFLTSSYMSPQVQHVTPNDLSVGVDGSRLSSHLLSRNQYLASQVDQVAPRDLSVTRDGFQMSFEMSPNYQHLPSAAEATESDNFSGYSFLSPNAQYMAPNSLAAIGEDSCISSYNRSHRYRYLSSKTGELSFATPQAQYATPNNLTRSSLRSSSQVPPANQTSRSYVEPFPSRMSYSGSAFVEAPPHSPDYFQNPPYSTDPCLSSSIAPASLYAPASRTPRASGQATEEQDPYEVPDIPRRRRRKNTLAGNPWFVCSTREATSHEDSSRYFIQPTAPIKEATRHEDSSRYFIQPTAPIKEATRHEDSSRYFIQPTTPIQNPGVSSTTTYVNLSTASSVPQDNLAPSSGLQGSFSTPQNRYKETSLTRDSNTVKLVPGSLPMPSQVPDNLSKNVDDRVSVATAQNIRYGTLASLEMARDLTQTPWDSVSHAMSFDASAPLQRVPRDSSAIPGGSFVVANDTTVITSAVPPATSTPRNSREAATVSRMFGDESAISKDEQDKNSAGTGRGQGTQSKVVRALNFDDHPIPSPPHRNSSQDTRKPTETYQSLQLSTTPPDLSTGPLNDTDSALLQSPTRTSENSPDLRSDEVSGQTERSQTVRVNAKEEMNRVLFESSQPRQRVSFDESTTVGGHRSETGTAGTVQTTAYRSLQIDTDATKFSAMEEMDIVDVWGPLREPHAEVVSIHQERVPGDSDREDLRDSFPRNSPRIRSPEKKREES